MQVWNLLWTVWLFLTPVFTSVGASYWWSLLSYPVFLLLFLLIYVRPYGEAGLYVLAMTMLACVSVPFNPTAWSYAVFACAYMPYYGSLSQSVLKIVFIQVLSVIELFWIGQPLLVTVMLLVACSSAGFASLAGRINAIKDAGQQRSHEEVRRLAALAERERIGRDLHDLLGHTLSLITLKLELSRKLFDHDHAAAKRELEEVEGVARHALGEVRAAVTGIRATDLIAELASARLLLESSGVDLHYDLLQQPLPESMESVLAMIVREAVTNIAKHARAARAYVKISRHADTLDVCITDNGRGGVNVFGNGLTGMRERVRSLAGTLQIESARGTGTTMRISVPLPRRIVLLSDDLQPAVGAATDRDPSPARLAGNRT